MNDDLETKAGEDGGRNGPEKSAEESTSAHFTLSAEGEGSAESESSGEVEARERPPAGETDSTSTGPGKEPPVEQAPSGPQVSIESESEPEEEVVLEVEGGRTEKAMPTTGAGEGLVRALSQLKQAQQMIEETEAKAKAAEDRLLRVSAEFENYKKRVGREREEDRKFANERILKELLPVVDNLERATEAAEGSSDEQLLSGVKMVLKQLLDVFKRFGVTQFSALGQPFDPERHEAMQQMATTEAEPGTVVSEYMKGFSLNERLLRPAMVVVAKAPEQEEMEGGGDGAAGAELPSSEKDE